MKNNDLLKTTMNSNQKGFTLIELSVSSFIFSILLFMIYSTFASQSKTNTTQSEIVDMHQNIRVSMHYITYALRMSGYDPKNTGRFGFTHADTGVIETALTGATSVALSFDSNGDGQVDKSENTAFRINGNAVEQLFYNSSTDTFVWVPLAENVEALNFVYLDEDNAVIAAPEASLDQIRSVQMTLIERTEHEVPGTKDARNYSNKQGSVILVQQNDEVRRTRLATTIKCRNMWL